MSKIEVEAFPCHDMTHPPEHRAPFCTHKANVVNRIEAPPGEEDMYFCDPCFGAGHAILDQMLAHADAGNVSIDEVLELIEDAIEDKGKPEDKN